MRVDEGRGEHEPGAVDHAVAVRVETGTDRADRSAVDPYVADRVEALDRVEDARAAHDQILAAVLAIQHHATSSGSAAATGTGPVVSRS